MSIRYLFLICVCELVNICSAEEIRILGMQSKEDIGHHYYTELLKLAVSASTPRYPNKTVSVIEMRHTTQGRTLNLLKTGFVDVFWAGTNATREAHFIPIRIPLFFGLLGYRSMLIHQDNYPRFQALLTSPEKLKSLVACQGEHWPDSDILEYNGFKVSRVAQFDAMFKMLAFKRCDYFPRAIFESHGELAVAKKQFPKLMVFEQLILHYPFAIYFFVNKNNLELAQQLEYGLNQAINDGTLLELMKNHPFSAQLFPLEKWQNKHYLHLSNPELTEQARLHDQRLWLKLY